MAFSYAMGPLARVRYRDFEGGSPGNGAHLCLAYRFNRQWVGDEPVQGRHWLERAVQERFPSFVASVTTRPLDRGEMERPTLDPAVPAAAHEPQFICSCNARHCKLQ